jgi:thioredoxin reductase (NADPH)
VAFGASFLTESVLSLKKEGDVFAAGLSNGEVRKAPAVIIAAGAKHRTLGVPGEQEFTGRGVSYCASCDGPFFRNKKIFVVGGGDAACDEARYLSRLSQMIVLVHRRDRFRAQKALAERVLHDPNIEVRFNTAIKEIRGGQKVSSVILERTGNDGKGRGETCEEAADAVFVFAGITPQSTLVGGGETGGEPGLRAELDGNGCILTDQKMASSVPGLFAAGDVRSGSFRQVVVACGEGAIAAHSAAEYIDEIRGLQYVR